MKKLDIRDARYIVRKIKIGEKRAVEEAIRLLDEDEIKDGSGYAKEYLWRAIAQASLTQRQIERLQSAALKYLNRKITREFWPMCRTMVMIANDGFQIEIDRIIKTMKGSVVQRAEFLQAYLQGINYGEQYKTNYLREARKGA
jgi:hypothetical protein